MCNCLRRIFRTPLPQPEPDASATVKLTEVRVHAAEPQPPRRDALPSNVPSSLGSGRGFPAELRTRPSTSGQDGRSSASTSAPPPIFVRVIGVNYDSLDDILANSEAKEQLRSLMSAQLCSENLKFLTALKAYPDDQTPAGRRAKLECMFTKWIGDDAAKQVNLSYETQVGLCAAWKADRQGAPGSEIDGLLALAEIEIRRLIQNGAVRMLKDLLVESPQFTGRRNSAPDNLVTPKVPATPKPFRFKRASLDMTVERKFSEAGPLMMQKEESV